MKLELDSLASLGGANKYHNSGVMMNLRGKLIRLTQLALGIDGILHLGAFVSAVIEEAWMTVGITGVQCLVFFFGVYFIGHDHSHHQQDSK